MARRARSSAEPRAADRRTLLVGGVAMVLLIGVGVASAALFTGSACDDVVPGELAAGAAGSDVRQVIDDTFADLDEDARDELVGGVSELAERLGPVTGAAQVGDARTLSEVLAGVASLGAATTIVRAEGPEIRATAAFEEPAVVVGGGATLYTLALTNELTGQVDAVQAIDLDLEPVGDCLDAATVNLPFAFHLDAGGSDLLLLRVEEDGAEPELELRGRRGARWQAPLEVVTAPPGVLGERMSARLGDELVVAARRVVPGERAAAVTAIARADGAPRWTVDPTDLPLGDEPAWVEVLAVTETTVLLDLGDHEGSEGGLLVALDAADGSVRWADTTALRRREVAAGPAGAVELVQVDGQLELRAVDAATGERSTLAAVDADEARAAVTQDGVVAGLGDGVVAADLSGDAPMLLDVPVEDVAVDDDGHASILLTADGDAVVVMFGAP